MISLYIGDFHISSNLVGIIFPPPPDGIGLTEHQNSGLQTNDQEMKISEVHSYLKQYCAHSSFYENKVLPLISAEIAIFKVPCFQKMNF